jgi:prepilin peptidase CpaA
MTEPSILSVLFVLLALASAWDIALHRIPNALVVGVMTTGFVAQVIHGQWAALVSSAIAVLATAAALWFGWTNRWIGGGDLKLAAAAAAWLGIARVPLHLLTSALSIGALSLACYALSKCQARAEVRRNLVYAAKGLPIAAPIGGDGGRAQVPAGAGFAIGAMVVLAMTGGL